MDKHTVHRRFMAFLAAVMLIGAACAPAAQPAAAPAPVAPAAPAAKPAPAAPQSQASPEKQPKYGGILVSYVAWDPTAISDPMYGGGQNTIAVAAMYNGLVRYDFVDTSKVIPDLAERWEVSPDGRTYTFYLRKDVKWQDGKPFGAWDVQFTYDRTLDKAQLARSGSWAKLVTELVAGWKTIDDYTFQITLKQPTIYFFNFLGSSDSRIGPKHMFDKERGTVLPKEGEYRWGVGTGPFRMVKYEEGAIVELVKNPYFFRKGLPYLDGIKRLVIPDRATVVAALASGRIMLGMQWPAQFPSEIKLIQEQAKGKVHTVPSYQNGLTRIGINAARPSLDNPKVRRAIFLAIDRWEVSERVLEGAGDVGTVLDSRIYGDWALPKEEVQKLPGIRKDKASDIAEAKKLLAEAGYPNGFEALWPQRATGDFIPTAEVVAAQLAKIGIKVKIESMDATAGSSRLNKGEGSLQVGCCGGASHSVLVMRSFLQPGIYNGNNTRWNDSNKEFVDMLDKAIASLDPVEAKKLVWDMQWYLLTKDPLIVPLVWVDGPVVVWNQVKNYYPPVYGFHENHDSTIIWLDQ